MERQGDVHEQVYSWEDWIEAKLVELVAMVGPFVSYYSGEHDTSRFSRVYPYGGMTQKEAMAFGLDPVLDGASLMSTANCSHP